MVVVTATLKFGHKEGLLNIWSEWCLDKKKYKKTKWQKKTKDKITEIQKDNDQKEFNIVMLGQFCTLAMFCFCVREQYDIGWKISPVDVELER